MNRLPLAQVTLCAVDCETPALSARALLQAQRGIAFGRVVLFTRGWLPTVVLPRLEVVDIEPLPGPADVADFVVRRLHAHVGTSHALLMRWDAGVLDPRAWSDEFLVPDHLAPPVGAGSAGGLPGLSLRSRRWMRAGADPRFTEPLLTDADLYGTHRGNLQSLHGVHFASEALARRFAATEGEPPEPGRFGFVGAAHLPALLGDDETLELVRRLPARFADGADAAAFEAALRAAHMGPALEEFQQWQARQRAAALRRSTA
jgi:hypothetical protein